MNITIEELRAAAEWLEHEGARFSAPDDRAVLYKAVDYLRFVADQHEEFQATRGVRPAIAPAPKPPQGPLDPRMEKMKAALNKVWSARRERVAGAR